MAGPLELTAHGQPRDVQGALEAIRREAQWSLGAAAQAAGTLAVAFTDLASGNQGMLKATHVFSAPGRVSRRRDLGTCPGEAGFRGTVATGTANDLGE